ncbi:MAG: glutathione S-transferase family protein [Azospirillum sp.]|nr:glutathione S-transferase family protein [Azospirillum sp.]
MGLLIDGAWHDRWYDTGTTGGAFRREDSRFRDRVSADGASGFAAEPGRYHLYVSLACPWAHRTLIFRALKKLEGAIGVTVVEPLMGPDGWVLAEAADPVNGVRFLRDLYTLAKPDYTGRVTVPVLWDTQRRTIVSNESAEIIRMLNREFDAWGDATVDFYPEPLRDEIDAINAVVYDAVNNGVYRAGFATSQDHYEAAFDAVFAGLDQLDQRLGRQHWLVGDVLTEADWRLFTTLVRFDTVYYGHFKCNLRRIAEYPNLSGYVRELYQVPGVAPTVNFSHIKRHYYASHTTINPTGIVPKGPALDLNAAHHRGRFQGVPS